MLVLFIECSGSNSSIQAEVGKLNGDLHQPYGIRYESRSFSVICLVSLSNRKGLISRVKMSIVVPQAMGISLHNTCYSLFFENIVTSLRYITTLQPIRLWKDISMAL